MQQRNCAAVGRVRRRGGAASARGRGGGGSEPGRCARPGRRCGRARGSRGWRDGRCPDGRRSRRGWRAIGRCRAGGPDGGRRGSACDRAGRGGACRRAGRRRSAGRRDACRCVGRDVRYRAAVAGHRVVRLEGRSGRAHGSSAGRQGRLPAADAVRGHQGPAARARLRRAQRRRDAHHQAGRPLHVRAQSDDGCGAELLLAYGYRCAAEHHLRRPPRGDVRDRARRSQRDVQPEREL